MSNKKSENVLTDGIEFSGLLTIFFIVLKLCHIINWSWVWVLSPLWICFAISFIIIIILIILYGDF